MSWVQRLGLFLSLGLLAGLLAQEFGNITPGSLFRRALQTGGRIWRHIMQDSLYRNSAFLILNMGLSALSGFLFWILNAHLFTTANVGYATTLISALGLASLLSGLGFNKTIVRFLAHREDKNRLIVTKLYFSVVASAISAAVLIWTIPHRNNGPAAGMMLGLFIISTITFSLKNLLDSVFVAYRAAGYTLAENSLANVSRLVLPFALMPLGAVGIFLSYVVASAVGVAASLFLLARKFELKIRQKPDVRALNGLWTFSLGSYAADIVGALPTLILPLIIAGKLGPTQAAYWYIAMLVASFLFMLCSSINQSLFAEAAHDETQLLRYIRKASVAMFGIVFISAALLGAVAPLVVRVFGPDYHAAVAPLRLLLISSLLVAGNYVAGSVLNMYRKVGYLTFVNAVNALVVLSISFFSAKSLVGFGWAWLIGEVINLALFGAGAVRAVRSDRRAPRSKTIALDGRYFSNPGTGINMYVKGLLRLLVDNGFDVTVVLYEMPPEPIAGLENCKIALVKRNRYKLDPLWEQISLPLYLHRHKFTYYIAPGNKGLPLLYFGKTKLVLTVHDLIPFHFVRMYFRKQPLIMLMYFPSILISLLRADKIMAVSQATAADIRRRFGRKSAPFMLPLRYMGVLDAKPLANTQHKKQFVYNGGTDPRKNVPLLIEAFAQFHAQRPDYTLVLMGGGYERFQSTIEAFGLTAAVQLTGYVSQEEKMRIVAESTAVVYPSLLEGYGLPIVEAMQAGVPIICGSGGSQREDAGAAGIVLQPVTKQAIVDALTTVAAGKTTRSYQSAAAKQLKHLASPKWERAILAQFAD